MCLLAAHSCLWTDHRQVALGCGRPCFYLFSLAEQLLSTRGCLKMLLAQSSQIVPGYACSFATRVLNHTLQFNSAAQQRSAGVASFSILYLDRRSPSITFSDTSTNRFWAAVWPSATIWRSKVLRPPFWPLGQSFRCRLPPCLRRTLRTNTTTINYTHKPLCLFKPEFWPRSLLAPLHISCLLLEFTISKL
jgi:hypothetical protein